jgi:hypothetical protein
MDTTCSANGKRQIGILKYEISTMWDSNPRTTPHRTSHLSMGMEQVTQSNPASYMMMMTMMMMMMIMNINFSFIST